MYLVIDIDEYAPGMSNCAADATCTNSPGSFTCICNLGYTGDGTVCMGKYVAMISSKASLVSSMRSKYRPDCRALYAQILHTWCEGITLFAHFVRIHCVAIGL